MGSNSAYLKAVRKRRKALGSDQYNYYPFTNTPKPESYYDQRGRFPPPSSNIITHTEERYNELEETPENDGIDHGICFVAGLTFCITLVIYWAQFWK